MNFRIRYLTEYRYSNPVIDNLNALRVKPAATPTQRCEEFSVVPDPLTRLRSHTDYFGTEVVEFGVVEPHERLEIDVQALVGTDAPPEPPPGAWADIESAAYRNTGAEYLLHTEAVPPNGALAELKEAMAADTPLDTVLILSDLIPDRFDYRQGVTYVGSTTVDLLEGGAGVCQDFAHLAMMLLRLRGIAARYVSGYLFATDENGGQDSIEVHTHAWVEALLPAPDEPVWVGFDPTNRGLAGERHVKIGHGRYYADVPPIKGVYRGPSESELEARVEMHRLGVGSPPGGDGLPGPNPER
jgi:transglutaminase-like putative cysteine protease